MPHPDDPLYCIEPWRSYAASTSGNSVDRDVTLDGSGSTTGSNVWYALPAARREAIGLILLYSNQMWNHSISVSTTKKDNNPNVPLRIATQFLIYEIVCGLRNPTTFESNSTNECGTSGDIFYNAGAASVPYFAPNYNALVDAIQAAKRIPSFTSASSGSAPMWAITECCTAATQSLTQISTPNTGSPISSHLGVCPDKERDFMNPKLQKLRAELEKNTEKISKLQSRNAELKKQIQELENIDIIYMVRECGLTPEALSGLLAKVQAAPNTAETKDKEDASIEA